MSRIEEIKCRIEKTTPGKWEWNSAAGVWVYEPETRIGVTYICGTTSTNGFPIAEQKEENAEFIAHAPDDIRYLITRIEDAEAALKSIYENSSCENPEVCFDPASAYFSKHKERS